MNLDVCDTCLVRVPCVNLCRDKASMMLNRMKDHGCPFCKHKMINTWTATFHPMSRAPYHVIYFECLKCDDHWSVLVNTWCSNG